MYLWGGKWRAKVYLNGMCRECCVCWFRVMDVVVQEVMKVPIPSLLHERNGSIWPILGLKHMGKGQQKGGCHRSPGSIPCACPSAKGKTAWKTSPSRSRRPTWA